MSKCAWCNGTGKVGSKFLSEPCPSCGGTGVVRIRKPTKTKTKTKVDGLTIICGEKSLWMSREAIEDMLNGKFEPKMAGRDITVTPNVVEVE